MMNTSNLTKCMVVALLLLGAIGQASGEEFEIESAVIESVSGKGLGVSREKGGIAEFFKAQKTMMFGILRSSGIDFNSLPVDVRARLEKFHTTNLEAFKAFSQGLDLMDDGKYAEAHAFFAKAAELDPNFKLAEEKKVAMPDMNLSNSLQLRTVIRDNAKSAVGAGMSKVQVDLSQAIAAMQSGQTIVVGASTTPSTASANTNAGTNTNTGANNYTSNLPGSGAGLAPRKAIGIVFNYAAAAASVGIASTNEWRTDQYTVTGNILDSVAVGAGGTFVAQRGNAAATVPNAYTLTDGSVVYWGSWSTPGSNASVIVNGTALAAPTLGSQVHYMMGDATRTMPTTGTAVFLPAAGFLGNVVGNLSVNFTTRQVNLNNLGFTLGALTFAGLNGAAIYDANITSGFFKGNYSAGACTGCVAFSPAASAFTGNFVGATANGTIVSSILQNGAGTVAGVHLFAR